MYHTTFDLNFPSGSKIPFAFDFSWTTSPPCSDLCKQLAVLEVTWRVVSRRLDLISISQILVVLRTSDKSTDLKDNLQPPRERDLLLTVDSKFVGSTFIEKLNAYASEIRGTDAKLGLNKLATLSSSKAITTKLVPAPRWKNFGEGFTTRWWIRYNYG